MLVTMSPRCDCGVCWCVQDQRDKAETEVRALSADLKEARELGQELKQLLESTTKELEVTRA